MSLSFLSLQKKYRDNPYHNRIHAADVLLATHYLLSAKPLEVHVLYTYLLYLVVAAYMYYGEALVPWRCRSYGQ